MKLRSIFASILASVALIGCVQEELPALKNIEVTPSYFTFGVEGGTKELKVTSAAAWEIKEALPEWVTVSALKGNASEKGESVTVTVAASTDTLARTAYLNFTCAGETQLVTVNQDAFVPDFPEFKGGDYWIVFEKGAALPLSSAYGYLYTAPVKEAEDGSIMGAATNIFTIKAVEGGFTIQDPAGQYYCMQGTYDSFNVYAELPEAGGVWTIKQTGKTAYEVANVANGKIMQYDPAYSSAGAYSSERGIYPNLVKVEVVPEPEPLGESMKIEEALEYKPELIVEGLVTATCDRGAILTDKSGSLLVYGISKDVAVGDSIKVSGKLSVYNKGYQLQDPYQYELVDSVKHEVKYPAATELTKTSIPELVKADFLAQYVTVKGIVSVDSYHNALIKVGDYTVKTYYSTEQYDALNEKAYEITGYLVSYKESAKEANLIVTKVSNELTDFVPEVEEPETPENPETPGEGGETTDPETPETPTEKVLSVAELVTYLKGLEIESNTTVSIAEAGDFVEGIVTATNAGGNLYKIIVIEDGEGKPNTGVVLYDTALDTGFNKGDKVKVTLANAKCKNYNGLLEVIWDEDTFDEDVQVVATGQTVTTAEISAEEFNSGNYLGMYVTVTGLKSTNAESATWVAGGKTTNTYFEDATGAKVVVRTTNYATWKDKVISTSVTGNLSGVVEVYNGTYQMYAVTESDVAAFCAE